MKTGRKPEWMPPWVGPVCAGMYLVLFVWAAVAHHVAGLVIIGAVTAISWLIDELLIWSAPEVEDEAPEVAEMRKRPTL